MEEIQAIVDRIELRLARRRLNEASEALLAVLSNGGWEEVHEELYEEFNEAYKNWEKEME